MDKPFWKDGLNFLCSRCSGCCRHEPGHVFLNSEDLAKILKVFNMTEDAFVLEYCRWVDFYDGYEYLSLNEKENNDCIFWDNGCRIYDSRPLQCKSFPFWPMALESKENWKTVTSGCPGCKNAMQNRKDLSLEVQADTEDGFQFPTSKKSKTAKTDSTYFSPEQIVQIRNVQLNSKPIKREKR